MTTGPGEPEGRCRRHPDNVVDRAIRRIRLIAVEPARPSEMAALLTLSARRPPPAGMTLEAKSAPASDPRARCCVRPSRAGMCSVGMSTTEQVHWP